MYTHAENRDKPFIDWRAPERRMEGFLLWLDWRMTYNDLDHYMCANTYRDSAGGKSPTGAPMTEEQTLWYCLIYGMTYQTEMAWVIYWHFPDFWKINIDELQKWNLDNLVKQLYAKDTKYNKGRITEQVKSMQELIGPYGSIKSWVEKQLTNDENTSFVNMFNEVSRLHKFGRMTSWLFTQALFETANLPVRPDTMLCTDPTCWSVRSGLCYLYGRDDLIEAKTKVKLSPADLQWIAARERDLYAQAYEYISAANKPIFSNYLLESQLCQYKKLVLGGDYGGHSSGDHFSRGSKLRDRWGDAVNFSAFFEDAIAKHHPLVRGKRENKPLRDLCVKTGQLINMHQEYDYLPNMYLELGIDPDWLFGEEHNRLIEKKIEAFHV